MGGKFVAPKSLPKAFCLLFCAFYVFDLVVTKSVRKSVAFVQKYACSIEDADPHMARAQQQCVVLIEKLTLQAAKCKSTSKTGTGTSLDGGSSVPVAGTSAAKRMSRKTGTGTSLSNSSSVPVAGTSAAKHKPSKSGTGTSSDSSSVPVASTTGNKRKCKTSGCGSKSAHDRDFLFY